MGDDDQAAVARPRRGEAREALLRVGLEALTTMTATDLMAGIGMRELSRRAGVSGSAANYHFPSLEAYAEALVRYVYDLERIGANAQVDEKATEVLGTPLPVEQAYSLHASELQRLTSDPEFRVRVGLWALGGAVADEPYAQFLREVEDLVGIMANVLYAS